MEISDIRIKLIQDSGDRLKAVCSITLDDEFVVRDLKVVEGTNGLFVAMPSRKLSVHCPQCRGKNHLRARFCNECGGKLPPARTNGDSAGRLRMHRDIAHPINPSFREIVQSRVIEKYRAESELAKNPDYAPADIDADYEEKIDQTQEDTATAYAPSEYDQLIAGLNKGTAQEPPRDSRPAPAPRAPRQSDRGRTEQTEQNDRAPRAPRGVAPRQQQAGRGDSRRAEPPRQPRNPSGGSRSAPVPAVPQIDAGVFDEVNGNIAPPAQPSPPPTRRPAPPPRRVEERPPPPRRTEERPPVRKTEDLPRENRVEEPPPKRAEAPPVQRPAPTPSRPSKTKEDLPFGAGL